MKRATLAIAALLALTIGLGGCGDGTTDDATEDTGSAAEVTPYTPAEGYDAMPAEGANESAALAALADVFVAQKSSGNPPDVDWDLFEGVEPRLVAYLVRVDLNGQVALFEVRADGIAHNIYGYHRAFDSGSINWTPAADSQGVTTAAASAGETSAAAAVEAAMRDAFPEEPFTVVIYGYRFAYVAAGARPLIFELAPDGSLVSVSQ